MKRFLTIFFVTLGVIFFVLILASVYFYVTDPWNLKPLLFGGETGELPSGSVSTTTGENANLSESQTEALESAGIDPAAVPSEFTAEQEACFVEVLGEERVNEIKAGSTPTPAEFLQARSCL